MLQSYRKITQIKVNKQIKIRRVCSFVWDDVFIWSMKTATDVDDFIACDRLFHACGPAKAKARWPNYDQHFRTTRLPADEERSSCLAATTVTEIHCSGRYNDARLCRALHTVRHSLNSICSGTRSQWRSCRMSDMWSYFCDEKWLLLQLSWPAEDDPGRNLTVQRKCSCSSRFSTTPRC